MKIMMVLLLMLCFLDSQAQDRDSAYISHSYAGILYTGAYNSHLAESNSLSALAGAEGKILLNDVISMNFRAGYEFAPNSSTILGNFSFEGKTNFAVIAIGYLSRPIATTMRPDPISAGGHFERPALSIMPGSGTGLLISKKWSNQGLDLMVGSFYLDTTRCIELDLSLVKYFGASNALKVSGFWGRDRKGLAFGMNLQRASLTIFASTDSKLSLLGAVRSVVISPYLSVIYDHRRQRDSFDDLELGWRRQCMASGLLRIIVGMGYIESSKLLNFYVQVYL